MDTLGAKPLPRRSKSGRRRWPRWLLTPRLFKLALIMGIAAYRLWRWGCSSILFFAESLETPSKAANTAQRGRGVIARKIIHFLRLVEERTGHAEDA